MITATTPTATPIKLRSGAWGAKTKAPVREGETITITTRAGKSWKARVTRVVWSGKGSEMIVATESLDRSTATGYTRSRGGGRGPVCRCAKSLDEGDGECMYCGYQVP